MSVRAPRWAVNLALVGMALAIVASIFVSSGRIVENEGLGYDGVVYARMMVESLDRGGANGRMRPLVLLTNQLVYDFLVPDAIRTFQVMNFVYSALFAFVLLKILDHYETSTPHKVIFIANVFATVAITKMFMFYPVLIDPGAYFWVSLSLYAILKGRRVPIVIATLLAVFSREFGLFTVWFGIHRDLRNRVPWRVIAATYLPGFVSFFALRQWVLSTMPGDSERNRLLSSADLVANLSYLVDPLFLLCFAYFLLTVFGGLSLLMIFRIVRRQVPMGGETEWLTYLAPIAFLSILGNADLWRYFAYAAPALAAFYAKDLAREDWRNVAPWAGLVTVLTQQPWVKMNDVSYFEDWLPLYLPVFNVPDAPTPQFWTAWIIRIAVVALLAGAVWRASRDWVPVRVRPSEAAV